MSGVKIPFAYDSSGNQVTILGYSTLGSPSPIYCGGRGCEAELVYVSASQRIVKNGVTRIPSYFRLAPHENHAISCSFVTSGKQVIDAAGSSSEIASALANGSRIFRIHLMDDDDQAKMKRKENGFLVNHNFNTVKRTYRTRGRKHPYVKNLKGLLELYDFGRLNPTQRSSIAILVGKQKVKWDDFFFDVKNYDKLHRKIIVNGPVKVAIVGHIHTVKFGSASNSSYSAEFAPKLQKKGNNIYPVARLKNGLSHSFINPGQKVLCFGSFKLETDLSKRVIPAAKGQELVMGLAAPYQLLEV